MTPEEIKEARVSLGLSGEKFADLLGFYGSDQAKRNQTYRLCAGKRTLTQRREKLLRNALQEKENGK